MFLGGIDRHRKRCLRQMRSSHDHVGWEWLSQDSDDLLKMVAERTGKLKTPVRLLHCLHAKPIPAWSQQDFLWCFLYRRDGLWAQWHSGAKIARRRQLTDAQDGAAPARFASLCASAMLLREERARRPNP
ncbi:unnamed protein product [Coccothraustes coccothraustes]